MKKKIIIIINPKSGSGKITTLKRKLDQYLDSALFQYEILTTHHRGHATELARAAVKSQTYAIIAAGGDGTINEVAQALVHTSTALGIIPMGSGNGLSYHLGMDRNINKAIKVINSHALLDIDSGWANDSFFVNVAGIGLDAAVAYRIMNNPNKGFIPYLLASLKESLSFKFFKAQVTIDDSVEVGEYVLVVVANGSFYGYNFAITPQALLDDGLFDVLLVKKVNLFGYIPLVYRMLTKTMDKSPNVIYKKAKKISIQTQDKTYFQIDGEGFVAQEMTNFKIKPSSLKLIVKKN